MADGARRVGRGRQAGSLLAQAASDVVIALWPAMMAAVALGEGLRIARGEGR